MSKFNTAGLTMLLIGALIFAVSGCRRVGSSTGPSNSANQGAPNSPVETSKPTAVDKGRLLLHYQSRTHPSASSVDHTVGTNREGIEKLLAQLNQHLMLPSDMLVAFKDCDSPDAFYDPDTHSINLCYELIDTYYDLFGKKIKDQTKLNEAVKGATAATFFHELGHGLIDVWKLPTTGREEDAVDQLSTLVLLRDTEDGEQMALNGALMFKLYAEHYKGEEKIYWDEHSVDEQRYYDTICMVYGSDHEKYGYLVKDGTLPEERAALCTEDYGKIDRAWRQLLAPYVKAESPSDGNKILK